MQNLWKRVIDLVGGYLVSVCVVGAKFFLSAHLGVCTRDESLEED